jgi:hypothetical protein
MKPEVFAGVALSVWVGLAWGLDFELLVLKLLGEMDFWIELALFGEKTALVASAPEKRDLPLAAVAV